MSKIRVIFPRLGVPLAVCQKAVSPKEPCTLHPVLHPHGGWKKGQAPKPCKYTQLTTAAREEKTQQCHLAEVTSVQSFRSSKNATIEGKSWIKKIQPTNKQTKLQEQMILKQDFFPKTAFPHSSRHFNMH